jgi:hypothetical protein
MAKKKAAKVTISELIAELARPLFSLQKIFPTDSCM